MLARMMPTVAIAVVAFCFSDVASRRRRRSVALHAHAKSENGHMVAIRKRGQDTSAHDKLETKSRSKAASRR